MSVIQLRFTEFHSDGTWGILGVFLGYSWGILGVFLGYSWGILALSEVLSLNYIMRITF